MGAEKLGNRPGLCISNVSASQPTRALAQPENPVRPTQGTFLPYLLLTSLIFPHWRGPRIKSQAFLRAWICFPQFQGLVVSTYYNFGEVEIRQRLPTLSTGCSHWVSSSFWLASSPFSQKVFLVLGVGNVSSGFGWDILVFSVLWTHADWFIFSVYWFLFILVVSSFLRVIFYWEREIIMPAPNSQPGISPPTP